MAAREIARGTAGVQLVAELLPRARPLRHPDQFGVRVNVPPGHTWGGNRMYITIAGGNAVFCERAIVYHQPVGEFVRERHLMTMGEGADRAAWLLPVAEAEMLFLMGFIGVLAGPVGVIASITVFLTRLTLFYTSHREEMDAASGYIIPTISGIREFSHRCPRVSWLLVRSLGWQAVVSGTRGVNANDVANFLGKAVGGLGRAPEITLGLFLRVVATTLGTTIAFRGPGAAGRGSVERARDFRRRLQQDGLNISEARAREIIDTPCFRDPATREALNRLQTNAEALMPLIEGLTRALQVEQVLGEASTRAETNAGAGLLDNVRVTSAAGASRRSGPVRGAAAQRTGEVRGGCRRPGTLTA